MSGQDWTALGQNLLLSLILLGVGAVLSYFLGPSITRRWEEGRKKVEIRIELIEKVLDVGGEILFFGVDITTREKIDSSALVKEFENSLNKWAHNELMISARLRIYSPKLDTEWRALASALRWWEAATCSYFSKEMEKGRQERLERVQEYLGHEVFDLTTMDILSKEFDRKVWDKINDRLVTRFNFFTTTLEKAEIKVS